MPNDTLFVECFSDLRDHQTVLSCKGPFTIQTLFAFQDAIRELTAPGSVVIDLSQVSYMDSAGLGALVGAHVSAQRSNRKLILVGTGERITALIRMSHLDRIFPMYTSRAEAASSAL